MKMDDVIARDLHERRRRSAEVVAVRAGAVLHTRGDEVRERARIFQRHLQRIDVLITKTIELVFRERRMKNDVGDVAHRFVEFVRERAEIHV